MEILGLALSCVVQSLAAAMIVSEQPDLRPDIRMFPEIIHSPRSTGMRRKKNMSSICLLGSFIVIVGSAGRA